VNPAGEPPLRLFTVAIRRGAGPVQTVQVMAAGEPDAIFRAGMTTGARRPREGPGEWDVAGVRDSAPPRRAARPAGAEHVPLPDRDGAMATAGVLFHFVGGSEELRARLARWMEHHPGDLDEQIMRWYLGECHQLLEPGCTEPLDWAGPHGRQR
jgi:hypothetical protein